LTDIKRNKEILVIDTGNSGMTSIDTHAGKIVEEMAQYKESKR
jgi:hypothetical protein